MGAYDRAAAARAKMAQVQREMSERRALRDRNFTQKRAQSLEAFKKQGPVMAQVAKHMGELGRRRAQAGGWATEKTEQDKDFVMGFGFEDEEQKDPYGYRPPQRPSSGPDTPPGGIGVIDDEDARPPMPPPAPEAPSAPAPPAPARPARAPRRPERQALDDEDDFSNQSSWMQNQ
jgi:hypothetical protein